MRGFRNTERLALHGECRRERCATPSRMLAEAKDGLEVVEGSVCRDRIHLCMRIAPKRSVSKAMGYLKGKSALVLFDHHPERGAAAGRDRTLWARGHFAATVGVNESVIKKYVREQEDASRIAEWRGRVPAACRSSAIAVGAACVQHRYAP